MRRSAKGTRGTGWWVRSGRLLAGLLAVAAPGGMAGAGSAPLALISRGDPPSDTTVASPSSMSADSRFVVFTSPGANLVAGQVDAGGTLDVFLYDRVADATTLVSRTAASPLTTGNGASSTPVISADGRFVAFRSSATNLVAGQVDANDAGDVFLHDRVAGTTALVSRAVGSATTTGNGLSSAPVISADGRFVAFESRATNLVAGQVEGNTVSDVFLHDRVTGTTTLVSRIAASATTTGSGFSSAPVISGDGRFVAFESRVTDLVVGQLDLNNQGDVFLYDRVAGTTALVSRTAGSATTTGSGGSDSPVISADGGFVAFVSRALDLVAVQVDGNGDADVFLYERLTGTTTLVSHQAGAAATAGDAGSESASPVISADGRFVAFASDAGNLVAGQVDGNTSADVFLYDRLTGTTSLVSRRAGSATTTGNDRSVRPALSADGGFVAFESEATDLVTGQVDGNDDTDVLLYDRLAGTTTLVSRTAASAVTTGNASADRAVIGGDGSFVAFGSGATDVVSGVVDLNGVSDAFLYEVASGTATLLSRRDPVAPSASAGDSFIRGSAVSADGRHIVFVSRAVNLVEGQEDARGESAVLLHDRTTARTVLVSRTAASPTTTGNGTSNAPVISEDGEFVVFVSRATNLVAGQSDVNDATDVFLYDRVAGTTTLVSHQAGAGATTGNASSDSPVISANGQFVAFRSRAGDLVAGQVDGNGDADVFLYDRLTGTTILVSHQAGSAVTAGDAGSDSPALSADGRFVVFVSDAEDLVASQVDGNGDADVFLYERLTGTTTLVSHQAGAAATAGDAGADSPALSADGGFVTFLSQATNLVAGQVDGNATFDVFLYDRAAGTTTLVSRTAGSAATAGNGRSASPALSPDGEFVAFHSRADDLVAGQVDGNATFDVFLYDREAEATTLVSRAAGTTAVTGNGFSGLPDGPALSADGRFVVFLSRATDLATGVVDDNGLNDAFLFDRLTGTTTLVSRGLARPARAGRAAAAVVATANDASDVAVLTADGTVVVLASAASNLTADEDLNGLPDVFVWVRPCVDQEEPRPCPGPASRARR